MTKAEQFTQAKADILGWLNAAQEILWKISFGVNDRVNLKAGLRTEWRDNSARTRRNLERTVKCTCRWCGSPLEGYKTHHARFCDADCRRQYGA